MNTNWHDMIQRYIAGTTTTEQATALEEALNTDAELRALYLDYMNLDVALEAAAGAVMSAEIKSRKSNTISHSPVRRSSHPWRWVAAAAACAALIMLAIQPRHRDPSPSRSDVTITIASAEQAIAQMSVESPTPLPAWMSPTASMLDQPRLPQ